MHQVLRSEAKSTTLKPIAFDHLPTRRLLWYEIEHWGEIYDEEKAWGELSKEELHLAKKLLGPR